MSSKLSQRNIQRVLFFGIPLVLVCVYLFFLAVERYRSESSYVIRDLSSKQELGVDLGIFGIGGSSSGQDAGVVQNYLSSYEMLQKVDDRFHLRDIYYSDQTDILQRAFHSTTTEDFLALYRKNLKIIHDEVSGITSIAFEISDRQLAREILEFLLAEGEAFLNRLNHQRAEKKTIFAASQLATNKEKLDQAILRLENFQNKHRLIDPTQDAAVQIDIIAKLESELVEKTSLYNQLRSFMVPGAIEVVRVEKNIEQVKAALTKAKDKLSGMEKERLNDLVFEFQRLKSDVEFARRVYEKTMVQYEVGKIEAMQESKLFEVISAPNLPEGHAYPRRLNMMVAALFLIFGFYKTSLLVWVVVQDHKD